MPASIDTALVFVSQVNIRSLLLTDSAGRPSFLHTLEQPSPFATFLSSQSSPLSSAPLPQTGAAVPSFAHIDEQPSLLVVLRSSQSSPISGFPPLPQAGIVPGDDPSLRHAPSQPSPG